MPTTILTITTTVATVVSDLASALGPGPAIAVLAIIGLPVIAATLVLTWHGLRGTSPGPAATHLLKLVELLLSRRRNR
jgi:hypothetical protein